MTPSPLQSPSSGSGLREGQCLGLGRCLRSLRCLRPEGPESPGSALTWLWPWTCRPPAAVAGLPSFCEDTPPWCGLMGLALGKAGGHWLPW